MAVITEPDPPAAGHRCFDEWREFQRYLATLPGLMW
jgi:hypothetical protein